MEKLTRYANISFRDVSGEGESREVEGIACVFNQPTTIRSWFSHTEEIDARAFDECDMSDVVLNFNHDDSLLLAGTRNGSLSLEVVEGGLKQRSSIIDTTTGNDVLKLVKSKLIDKMSFAFSIDGNDAEAQEWIEREGEMPHRIIRKIRKLYDVSLVTFPAYDQTSVSAKSANEEDPSVRAYAEKYQKRQAQKEKMEELLNGYLI